MKGSILSQKPPGYERRIRKNTMGPTKLAIKLQKVIADVAQVDVIPVIHRTHAGVRQKANGAFSWFMMSVSEIILVGSMQTATEIAKEKEVKVGYTDSTTVELYGATFGYG